MCYQTSASRALQKRLKTEVVIKEVVIPGYRMDTPQVTVFGCVHHPFCGLTTILSACMDISTPKWPFWIRPLTAYSSYTDPASDSELLIMNTLAGFWTAWPSKWPQDLVRLGIWVRGPHHWLNIEVVMHYHDVAIRMNLELPKAKE